MATKEEMEVDLRVRQDDKFRADNNLMRATDEANAARFYLERAEDELAFAKWSEKYLRGLYEASKVST